MTATGKEVTAAAGHGTVPGPRPPAGAGAPPPSDRRPAWAEGLDRLRVAAVTEPGRLRIIGAVLAVLIVAFGSVTAWQITGRAAAADAVVHRSEPLSSDAAEIYRSLADADTTAADGFLTGGEWPREVLDRYRRDILTASTLIAKAARNTEGSAAAREQITRLNRQLPVYTGLVETARTNDRQGLPLGGAYLRYANEQMRTDGGLLDAANMLYTVETARLGEDYAEAKSLPWAAWVLGGAALAGLFWAQRRTYRRTNRVFNQGLLAATAATVVVLLWLVVGHTVARTQLTDSYEHGARSLQVLNEARISALMARGDENLTLVARGAGAAYEENYKAGMTLLADDAVSPGGALLDEALAQADDTAGRTPVQQAADAVGEWRKRHAEARASDNAGDYDNAVAKVIGGEDDNGDVVKDTTGESFDAVAVSLAKAVAHEQAEFERAAGNGRAALSGLAAGSALLAVLGAAGAMLGIERRLSEYQ